jgi:hypothetical protein
MNMKKAGRVFFFEKKKQKTFIALPLPTTRHSHNSPHPNGQKFFASFFQKRRPFLVFFFLQQGREIMP